MKSIQAEYDESSKKISVREGAEPESWVDVCRKFNDDVSRICDVTDMEGYTGLFECFDDANKGFYYLVEENKALFRMKQRHFRGNLGLDD